MLFAVIQNEFKSLDPCEVEDVFSQVYGLNKIDARAKVLLQPKGIIAFGLEEDKASYMVDHLTELDYCCHKQSIESLLPIPDFTPVHSALFSEDGLVFENLFGEQKKILWNHMQMIEVFRIHNKSVSLQNRKTAKRVGKPSTVTIKKEMVKEGRYLEIYSDSPFPRLQIDAARFNFSSLGSKMTQDSQVNFELLLSEIQNLCTKFNVPFEDSSHFKSFLNFKDFESYSHWKLQQID